MRGDRPLVALRGHCFHWATPHARGSTSSRILSHVSAQGYPACAGIDRTCFTVSGFRPRLPRMRGDRPHWGSQPRGPCAATPHARGSTRCKRRLAWHGRGYPACAGIDLIDPPVSGLDPGLPRMRGDRPSSSLPSIHLSQATPHARGSTCKSSYSNDDYGGYPACAGIDLSDVLMSPSKARLPRMRGDRPHLGFSKV